MGDLTCNSMLIFLFCFVLAMLCVDPVLVMSEPCPMSLCVQDSLQPKVVVAPMRKTRQA